ncbi:MAG: hypothetical protein WC314_13020 [Vulcanimicrobiota bacterium]
MKQLLRGLALLSSILLLFGFLFYRTHKPVEATALPASLPLAHASPSPEPTATPDLVVIPSTKSAPIILPNATATPPAESPPPDPAFMPGSKSGRPFPLPVESPKQE